MIYLSICDVIVTSQGRFFVIVAPMLDRWIFVHVTTLYSAA